MSLAQRIYFLQDLFQMTAIALVSVINHYHINGLQSILRLPVVNKFQLQLKVWSPLSASAMS